MSAAFDWNLWRPFFITLALGTTLVFLAVMMMQRWIRSMAWRRTLWQIAFLSLGLLATVEISGTSRMAWGWMQQQAEAPTDGTVLVESKVIGEPDIRMLLATQPPEVSPAAVTLDGHSLKQASTWWPGVIWLAGFGVAMAWMTTLRLFFLVFVPRRIVKDEMILSRVDAIARRLGMSERVRVTEARGLAGPIAFGVFRASISLPEGFARRFSGDQQDVMLAHELAHLAARDPLWHALADIVMSILWWHPLAWLAKRELRSATESAADEASLVVENGPTALAECLVELAGRLTRTRSLGWLGMEGGDFRSGLGKRVKRLVSLNRQPWNPPASFRVWLVRMVVPLVLVALVLVSTVWAQPMMGGPSTLRQAFQESVLGIALTVAMPTPQEKIIAPNKSNETATTQVEPEKQSKYAIHAGDTISGIVSRLREHGIWITQKQMLDTNPGVQWNRLRIGQIVVIPAASGAAALQSEVPMPNNREQLPETLARSGNTNEYAIRDGDTLSRIVQRLREQGLFITQKQLMEANPGVQWTRLRLGQMIVIPEAATAIARQNSTPAPVVSERQKALNQKLNSIRLSEISFPGLPLSNVIEKLAMMVKAADPDGKGINFIINNATGSDEDPSGSVPNPQNVIATPNVLIQLKPPLRDVTLGQVLHAIMRCAETPLRYSVEDYAVVISSGQATPPLHTRSFKIDPATFKRALFDLQKTNLNQAISEALSEPPRLTYSTGKVHIVSPKPVNSSESMVSDARRFFTMAGVDLTVPGKSLLLNERLGQLMVRATLQDLDIIEQAVQLLNMPTPQLTIEVKFFEIETNDPRALGLDWILGGEFTNMMFSLAAQKTNFQATRVLTDPQSRVYFRAMEQRGMTNLLGAPKMTTLSGRPGQFKHVNVRYIVTDLDWSHQSTNVVAGIKDSVQAQPIAELFELGPVLDVVPYVLPDGYTIQMTLIPTFTEFLGYDLENGNRQETVTMADGRKEIITVPNQPCPIFRKRQMVSNAIVWDGQTVVMAGGSEQFFSIPTRNEPLRKGTKIPTDRKPKHLLIFVTPTLIDPAGNRIHKPEDIPPGIPPQQKTPPGR